MNHKFKLKNFFWLSAMSIVLVCSERADAGAISGSNSQAANFNCDSRKAIVDKGFSSWCTSVNAKIIKNKCVVVIHLNSPVENCGWQGCGHLSFVNERPKLIQNNVVEYGISTPSGVTAPPFTWEPNNGTVMPKAPFPRHYLSVDQFVGERSKCATLTPAILAADAKSGGVLAKLCNVSKDVLDLNPYYFCMKKEKVVPAE
ncbi:MAG: hypothetical protein RI932_381 [Pseudomonadota bacterium]|jgi:hypothetical protein